MKHVLSALLGAATLLGAAPSVAQTTLTIATVNNGDMIRMQALTNEFTAKNPDITVKWVTLEENVLRQRVTTDIATKGGQFDVLTIGTYEVPIWAKKNWLIPLDNLGPDYDAADLLPKIRDAVSVSGKLYAAPFYGESSMVMYRTDLFQKAGLTMPEKPTWDFVIDAANKLTDKSGGVYGICLSGKAGWGENMAFLTAMSNSFGARWFDEKWQPQFDKPEWKKTLSTYVDLMKAAGPPGASSNGFNENLALFNSGKCAMWIDATVAASFVTNPEGIQGRRQGRLRARAECGARQERQLAVGMESRDPRGFEEDRRRREVHRLGDQQGLHQARRLEGGLGQRAARHANLALPESGISEGRAVRQADAGIDQCRRSEQADRAAGALRRRAIRGHSGIPGHRHQRRPAILGGAGRFIDGGRRARSRASSHRTRNEARRLYQIARRANLGCRPARAADGSRISLQDIAGGGDGDAANPGPRKGSADAGRRIAVHLDDRPARHDDLFLDAALQPARSRKAGASSGWRIFDTFSPIPLF